MSVVGWALGLIVFVLVTPVIRGSLFATDPTDPVTLIAVGIVLFATAGAAGTIPARRASDVEPAEALGAGTRTPGSDR